VKIVDFGIAKVLVPQEGEKQRQLTQAGEIFGSPAYMSPEQCSGKALDGRSDLYSFGCMMYEAMSGQLPHIGDNFINTVVKHINEEPKSIAEVSPNARVPEHIEQVIMKCLQKKANDRYSTALELKQALFDAAYASGVKGLKFGAVPEPKQFGNTSAQTRATISLTEMKVTQTWRLKLSATIAVFVVILSAIVGWFYIYPGPVGDRGTLMDKMLWQGHLSKADSLDQQQRYREAVKELEAAREIAVKFGDHHNRLETTLNKLALEYGLVHDYTAQEAANKQVIKIGAERVSHEYEVLMGMLAEWEKPTNSNTKTQERALQAIAFADRIEHCADKLYTVSREREELLLQRAIKVFSALETIDWRICEQLRISLAECYHVQQRFGKQREVLLEAVKNCPEDPVTDEGWRTKIQAKLLLAQLDRDETMNEKKLDGVRQSFEEVLDLIRKKLPADKQLMRDTMNSIVILDRLYHTKEFDERANAIEKESKALESALDSQAANTPPDDSSN
ncbi:MAG: serine/threonine-protein kinase, partial [Candidatus Obscuribacterales bacterium]|nr:serine/threonine-protein kinase [Candidatus Obscuribacterales bacterium]